VLFAEVVEVLPYGDHLGLERRRIRTSGPRIRSPPLFRKTPVQPLG
jgi:hypothetical protein